MVWRVAFHARASNVLNIPLNLVVYQDTVKLSREFSTLPDLRHFDGIHKVGILNQLSVISDFSSWVSSYVWMPTSLSKATE